MPNRQDVHTPSQVFQCTCGCCGHSRGSLQGTVHVVKRDEVSQGSGIGRAWGKTGEVRLLETDGHTLQIFAVLGSDFDDDYGYPRPQLITPGEWRMLKLLCSVILRAPFLAGSVHLQEPT